MEEGAPECILFGHFLPSWDWGYLEGQDPIPGGAEGTAASPFPMLRNASHPFHPTSGQLPPFRLRVGGEGGQDKARLGNVLIILGSPDRPHPPSKEDSACSRKVSASSLQELLTPSLRRYHLSSYWLPKENLDPAVGRRGGGAAGRECRRLKLSADLASPRRVMTPGTPSHHHPLLPSFLPCRAAPLSPEPASPQWLRARESVCECAGRGREQCLHGDAAVTSLVGGRGRPGPGVRY